MCSVTDESDDAMSVSAEEARETAGNMTNTCCPAMSQIIPLATLYLLLSLLYVPLITYY